MSHTRTESFSEDEENRSLVVNDLQKRYKHRGSNFHQFASGDWPVYNPKSDLATNQQKEKVHGIADLIATLFFFIKHIIQETAVKTAQLVVGLAFTTMSLIALFLAFSVYRVKLSYNNMRLEQDFEEKKVAKRNLVVDSLVAAAIIVASVPMFMVNFANGFGVASVATAGALAIAAVGPIIFAVTLGLKALYHLKLAHHYWEKSKEGNKEERERNSQKFKSNLVVAGGLTLMVLCIVAALILGGPVGWTALGVVGCVAPLAYIAYNHVQKKKPEKPMHLRMDSSSEELRAPVEYGGYDPQPKPVLSGPDSTMLAFNQFGATSHDDSFDDCVFGADTSLSAMQDQQGGALVSENDEEDENVPLIDPRSTNKRVG